MPYTATTAVNKILELDKRVRVIQGGARAGKSIAILLILIDLAQASKKKRVISVVSETIPHLKRGVMRDFLSIMKDHGYYRESDWNKSDFIYNFPSGTIIEFFSADNGNKLRGPARDVLFINECNNVTYEAYTQLILRTSEFAYLDYNPVAEFWVHEEVIPRKDSEMIILTYKDNEGLAPTIVEEIESRRGNRNFWRVYGLGLIGDAEGKIFKDWKIVDEIPHEARLVRYGLDFGYSNDPTAIVAIYYYNGGYILDEITYQKGLSNKQIADIINNQPKSLVMADSAEPKSIDELMLYGCNVLAVTKGQGSVNQGIQYVQDQQISITKRSINGIKEYRNYMWQTDKEGKIINTPIDLWNHFLDATRYGFESLRPKEKPKTHNRPQRLKFHI